MIKERNWKFYTVLIINLICICAHIIFIIFGSIQKGSIRIGIIVVFSVSLGYALLFLIYWLCVWLIDHTPDRGEKADKNMWIGYFLLVIYISSLIIMVQIGFYLKGNLKIGIIAGGSIALGNTFIFLFLIWLFLKFNII